jgi:predicted metal-dependent enzyme (double-stranded beta helix superfamily)
MASYSFDAFLADCKADVKDGEAGRERIRRNVERLLSQPDFVAAHFGPDAEPGVRPIYTDPETGFQVLAHVYNEGKQSPPHDHGASWAVYGQAVAHTDMQLWQRTDDGNEASHAEVEVEDAYRLDPPKAGKFEPGQIHSIKFPAGARFLRVTGTDLTKIPTRRFDTEAKTVVESEGASGVGR